MGALDAAWRILKEEANIQDGQKMYQDLDLWSNARLLRAIDATRKFRDQWKGKGEKAGIEEELAWQELLDEQNRRIKEGDVPHAGQWMDDSGDKDEKGDGVMVLEPNAWDKSARYTDESPKGDPRNHAPWGNFNVMDNEFVWPTDIGFGEEATEVINPNTDPYRTVYGPFGRGRDDDPNNTRLQRIRDFQDIHTGETMDILDTMWSLLKEQ